MRSAVNKTIILVLKVFTLQLREMCQITKVDTEQMKDLHVYGAAIKSLW